MSLSATVNAQFKIDSKVYSASLMIPSAAPTAALPFLFAVTTQGSDDAAGPSQTLLQVAVGGSGQAYIAVSPPMDLISGAVGADVVEQLNVVISEGSFDTTMHTFAS